MIKTEETKQVFFHGRKVELERRKYFQLEKKEK